MFEGRTVSGLPIYQPEFLALPPHLLEAMNLWIVLKRFCFRDFRYHADVSANSFGVIGLVCYVSSSSPSWVSYIPISIIHTNGYAIPTEMACKLRSR